MGLVVVSCTSETTTKSQCASTNGIIAEHSGGCTVYRSFATERDLQPTQVKSLIIFMHGDMSSGHNDYMHRIGTLYRDRIAAAGGRNALVLSPLRKGYGDGKGNRSSGRFLKRDEYLKDVVDHTQGFLEVINAQYPNAKVTLVGHSGGAAIASVIAGRAPNLAESYVLVGTPGDIEKWRREYRNTPWPKSLNPIDYINGTDPKDRFVIISSDGDEKAPLPLSVDYHQRLRDAGSSAELINLGSLSHSELTRHRTTIRKIWEVAK